MSFAIQPEAAHLAFCQIPEATAPLRKSKILPMTSVPHVFDSASG